MKDAWQSVETGWHHCKEIGSIRSAENYGKGGGWWFLAAWLPDDAEHDVGPFKTLELAKEHAGALYRARAALRKEERG